MSNQLYSGQGRDINVFAGQSLAVSSITGAYTATIIAGAGIGTALATDSTGGATYGPYAGGVTIRLVAGEGGLIDYEAAVSPVLNYAGPARFGYSSAGDSASVVDGAGNTVSLGATTSTWANRAALVTAGATQAFFTDVGVGGSFWFYSSGRWRPVGGRAVLKNLTTLATHNTSTRAILDYATILAGLWQDGDVIEMEWGKTLSGTDTDLTETGLGTVAIASFGDSMAMSTAILSNSNPQVAGRYRWRKLGPTSVLPMSISGSVGYGAAGTIAATPTISTNLDTTQSYLQISATLTTGAGAITTLRSFTVTLISGA